MSFRGTDKRSIFIALGMVGAICTALYPIAVYPYLHIEEYKESQRINREGIDRDEIQPGNMRVWSDPFIPREDNVK